MRKTVFKIVCISLVTSAIISLILYDLYLHNFHTVIPNQVYRSRELSRNQFKQAIKRYDLKSILNLRGKNPGKPWYKTEMTVSKKYHIHHYNIALSSHRIPSLRTFKELVTVIDTAPRPLLIHCRSGVDRTGLGALIALILNDDHSMTHIKQQISIEYFAISHLSVGKQVLKIYKKWLQEKGLASSRNNFFDWLKECEEKKCLIKPKLVVPK